MTVSNGIHLPELCELEWIANHDHNHTLQSRDITKTASTVSGAVIDSEKPRVVQHQYLPSRIEDIVIIREADTPNNFGQKGYLRFENVTMVCLGLCFLQYNIDADTKQVPDTQESDRR